MLANHERVRLRGIADELRTIRLESPELGGRVLAEVQALTELEVVLLYSVSSRSGRWAVDRWSAAGVAGEVEGRFRRMLERRREMPLYYNPLMPLRQQRNRVIDALTWIDEHAPGTWDTNPLAVEVMRPLKMHRHRQPRALLCDGADLLAWFGGLHPSRPTPRQLRVLAALIPPLRQRLIAERRLLDGPIARAALDVMLDRVGAPAFVVDARGGIHDANRAGRALRDERRPEIEQALRDAVAGVANALAFELIDVSAPGLPAYRIAILRADSVQRRIDACVGVCVQRWQLTPRQAEVLRLVVSGAANATIAATLGCVERTVELHVTALLDRAGVDSRAALACVVLTA